MLNHWKVQIGVCQINYLHLMGHGNKLEWNFIYHYARDLK